jgi:molybdopterin/thiamine biosynthesis adenylyltransferase
MFVADFDCRGMRTKLQGWGVDKFKIVDNGTVSFSNPARQSLYTFEDCIENANKVHAAARAMHRIDPNVVRPSRLPHPISTPS